MKYEHDATHVTGDKKQYKQVSGQWYWYNKRYGWTVSGLKSDYIESLLTPISTTLKEPLNPLGTFGEPEENPNGTGLKYDAEKPMYNLIPPVAINSLAEVMTFGARKYQPNSWQNVENGLERYRAALLRHVFAIQRGELVDPESGLNHSAHALACAAFINELERMEK